jgi:hypothetical protein
MLRQSVLLSVLALVAFAVAVVLHNAISAAFGVEEPVFFLIAVVIAPVAFVVGLVATIVALIAGWRDRRHVPPLPRG